MDTCQYLDYPTTTFSLPELMDMELLQQSLPFNHNTPCFDSTLDGSIKHYILSSVPEFKPYVCQYSYLYLHPYQCLPQLKPCMPGDVVDFSTTAEKLPNFEYFRESKPSVPDSLIYFSTTAEKLPQFQCQVASPVFSIGSGGSSDGTLLVLSLAVRQRRRRITERMQELGKLVPGGNKMSTSEMFGVVYKYIKYLQAQVGVLQLLGDKESNYISFLI